MAVELTDETKDELEKQANLNEPTDASEDPKEPSETPEALGEPKEPSEDTEPVDLGEPDPEAFDINVFEKDLEESGDISEESIKAAKEKYSPEFVDEKVARMRAEHKLKGLSEYEAEAKKKAEAVSEMNKYIFETVGGTEEFQSMKKTLRSSLTASALESLNAKLLSGNKTLVSEGLEIAVKEYKKLKGIGGKRMEGDANAPAPKELRVTREDYRTIMKTEKYKTDPMYREKIDEARLKTRQADQAKYGPGMYYGYNQNGRYEL